MYHIIPKCWAEPCSERWGPWGTPVLGPFHFLFFSNYEQVLARVADSAMLRVPLTARASVTSLTQGAAIRY